MSTAKTKTYERIEKILGPAFNVQGWFDEIGFGCEVLDFGDGLLSVTPFCAPSDEILEKIRKRLEPDFIEFSIEFEEPPFRLMSIGYHITDEVQ